MKKEFHEIVVRRVVKFAKYLKDFVSAHPTTTRIVETGAAVAPVLFLLFSTGVQLTHPGYNPWQSAISELVWGPFGWVQTSFFYILALSVMVQVIKLFMRVATVRFRIGVALFALVGIGVLIIGLLPTDLPGVVPTIRGLVHLNTTAVLLFLFPAACFFMAPGLRVCFQRKWLTFYTHVTGLMTLALIAVIAVLVTGNFGWIGMLERMILVNGLMWLQVLNIHML